MASKAALAKPIRVTGHRLRPSLRLPSLARPIRPPERPARRQSGLATFRPTAHYAPVTAATLPGAGPATAETPPAA